MSLITNYKLNFFKVIQLQITFVINVLYSLDITVTYVLKLHVNDANHLMHCHLVPSLSSKLPFAFNKINVLNVESDNRFRLALRN